MRNFLEQTLRSYFPLIAGVLLFIILWGGCLAGFWWKPLTETTLSFFGTIVTVSPLTQSIVSPLLYVISAYLLFRTIGEFQLFSTRTHFPTGLFFALVAGASFLLPLRAGSICLPIMMIAAYMLMTTYQQHDSISEYVIAFALVSLASILFPKWLLLVPFFLIGGGLLQSLTPRTFMAALIGLIIPYWISAGMLFLCDDISSFVVPFQQLIQFDAIKYQSLTLNEITAGALLLLIAVPGIVLFPSTLFAIKEKARVCYQFLLLVFVAVFILALLQPTLFADLFPLLMTIATLFVTNMLLSGKSRLGGVYLLMLIIFYLVYISQPLWEPLKPF
ncbi:MAG: hypothetical protein J5814_06835 [Bacteroidaceae bacterium]|nr:hypothetical protein [Bacteroidaceae bacterium]